MGSVPVSCRTSEKAAKLRYSNPKSFQRFAVQLDPQAGLGRNVQIALGVGPEWLGNQFIQIGRRRQELDVASYGQGGGERQVRRQSAGRVPTVRNEQDVVLVSHPA